MKCYACANDAESQCERCGRPYCDAHGEAFCGECLKPASALPSFTLYRGSLLALLVGTALAVWLIVRPPGESDESSPGVTLPGALVEEESPTPQASPAPTGSPSADLTPTPSATSEAESPQEYTVQEGDTLYGIAEAYLPPGEEFDDFVSLVAELNDLGDPDEAMLFPGQVLRLSPGSEQEGSTSGATPVRASPTAAPTGTPSTPASPTPEPTAAPTEYVVQEGDTLYGVAEAYLPPGENLGDFVVRIAQFNGLGDPNEVILRPGQVVRIPP